MSLSVACASPTPTSRDHMVRKPEHFGKKTFLIQICNGEVEWGVGTLIGPKILQWVQTLKRCTTLTGSIIQSALIVSKKGTRAYSNLRGRSH